MAIHDNYDNIDRETRSHVDDCFQGIFDYLDAFGYNPAGDDRAEFLVEAIATYIVESNR